jgi:hypothetical protein
MIKRSVRVVLSVAAIVIPAASGCAFDDQGPDVETEVDQALSALPLPSPRLGFVVIPPCRLVDTRVGHDAEIVDDNPLVGGSGGPAGLPTRDFKVNGNCGIPDDARALSGHIATVLASGIGFIELEPANGSAGSAMVPPQVSALNYVGDDVAADAFDVGLGFNGVDVAVRVYSHRNTDFVLDVTGYYTALPTPPTVVTPNGPLINNDPTFPGPRLDELVMNPPGVWGGWNDMYCVYDPILMDYVPVQDPPTGPGVPEISIDGVNPTPPLGAGAFRIDLSEGVQQGAALYSQHWDGKDVNALSTLKYSAMTTSSNSQAAYFVLKVDEDGNGSTDHNLFYYPYHQTAQAPLRVNTWQTWDALHGVWNESGDPGTAGSQPLASWLTPTSKISGIRIVAGCGGDPAAYTAGIDNVQIGFGVDTEATTYDFENN